MVIDYPGQELDLFKEAITWKKYFAGKLQPFISGDVLEVGAGLGETSPYLFNNTVSSWTAIEPDLGMYVELKEKIRAGSFPFAYNTLPGTLDSLDQRPAFDTIIYIDVLEHIEHDSEELRKASGLLLHGGHLIVLSPAYQWVYNKFDKAIGHFRRYNRSSLMKAGDHTDLCPQKFFYLDSCGVALLLVNKALTRESYPTLSQVKIWDRWFVPVSKIFDRISGFRFGKTIIGIWTKR